MTGHAGFIRNSPKLESKTSLSWQTGKQTGPAATRSATQRSTGTHGTWTLALRGLLQSEKSPSQMITHRVIPFPSCSRNDNVTETRTRQCLPRGGTAGLGGAGVVTKGQRAGELCWQGGTLANTNTDQTPGTAPATTPSLGTERLASLRGIRPLSPVGLTGKAAQAPARQSLPSALGSY